MPFPSGDEASEVVEPGEEAFDDPPALVAPEGAPILSGGTHSVVAMRGDQVDPEGLQELAVQRITIVGAVANQVRRVLGEEAVFKRGVHEPDFSR